MAFPNNAADVVRTTTYLVRNCPKKALPARKKEEVTQSKGADQSKGFNNKKQEATEGTIGNKNIQTTPADSQQELLNNQEKALKSSINSPTNNSGAQKHFLAEVKEVLESTISAEMDETTPPKEAISTPGCDVWKSGGFKDSTPAELTKMKALPARKKEEVTQSKGAHQLKGVIKKK